MGDTAGREPVSLLNLFGVRIPHRIRRSPLALRAEVICTVKGIVKLRSQITGTDEAVGVSHLPRRRGNAGWYPATVEGQWHSERLGNDKEACSFERPRDRGDAPRPNLEVRAVRKEGIEHILERIARELLQKDF